MAYLVLLAVLNDFYVWDPLVPNRAVSAVQDTPASAVVSGARATSRVV